MVFGGGESEAEILGCLGTMLLVGKSKREEERGRSERGGETGRRLFMSSRSETCRSSRCFPLVPVQRTTPGTPPTWYVSDTRDLVSGRPRPPASDRRRSGQQRFRCPLVPPSAARHRTGRRGGDAFLLPSFLVLSTSQWACPVVHYFRISFCWSNFSKTVHNGLFHI
jgi:hypothetical protein